MTTDIPSPGGAGTETDVLAKVTYRIVPFLFLCYVVAFIDRINIGFAQLQMKQDLGFSDAIYGFGAGVFFIGYVIFEVPSNLVLMKIGARKTFSRIMICWGVVSSLTLFVQTPLQFYVMRFLLGAFEAGFFPGILLYLSFWFPQSRRAGVVSWFFVGTAFAGIVGGLISGVLLHYLDNVAGLHGWQWMFLIEGLPSIVLGGVVLARLVDLPADAKWLDDGEKRLLQRLIGDGGVHAAHGVRSNLRELLADPSVYAFAAVYFALACGAFALSFWMPAMLRDFGIHDPLWIGVWSAVPYTFGSIGIVLIARHSDATGERRRHFLLCTVGAGVSLWSLTFHVSAFWLVIVLLSISVALVLAAIPIFWAVPFQRLRPQQVAGKIALISSIGQLGGFASPYGLGLVKTATGRLDDGLSIIAGLLVLGGIVLWRVAGHVPTKKFPHSLEA